MKRGAEGTQGEKKGRISRGIEHRKTVVHSKQKFDESLYTTIAAANDWNPPPPLSQI